MSITKDDLHHLVDSIATNERSIKKAHQLLSIVRDEESDSIHPIPLPSSGFSVDDFLNSWKITSCLQRTQKRWYVTLRNSIVWIIMFPEAKIIYGKLTL